jgi:hypothetical protein
VTLGFRIEWTDASDWRLASEATVYHGYFDGMHVDDADALRKGVRQERDFDNGSLDRQAISSREITSRGAVLASLAKHS